jgi:hypothetical protein
MDDVYYAAAKAYCVTALRLCFSEALPALQIPMSVRGLTGLAASGAITKEKKRCNQRTAHNLRL